MKDIARWRARKSRLWCLPRWSGPGTSRNSSTVTSSARVPRGHRGLRRLFLPPAYATTNGSPDCLLATLANEGITSLKGAGITTFDTQGQGLLNLFPLPNTNLTTPLASLLGSSNAFNFEYQPALTQYTTTYDGRVDHHFSQTDSLTGHYTFNNFTTTTPSAYPAVGGIYGGGGQAALQRVQKVSLDEIHIFRPTLLLDLKANYLRYANNVLMLNGVDAASKFGDGSWACTADSCINSLVGGAGRDLVKSAMLPPTDEKWKVRPGYSFSSTASP